MISKESLSSPSAARLWTLEILLRFAAFGWLVLFGKVRIMVNVDNMCCHKKIMVNVCLMCLADAESVDHLLDCY